MKLRVMTGNIGLPESVNGVAFAPFTVDGVAAMVSEEITEDQAEPFLSSGDFRKAVVKDKDAASLDKQLERVRSNIPADVRAYKEKVKALEAINDTLVKENQDLREIAKELAGLQDAKD